MNIFDEWYALIRTTYTFELNEFTPRKIYIYVSMLANKVDGRLLKKFSKQTRVYLKNT